MSLYDYLLTLPDPRRSVGLRTDLGQILCMTVLSYLCGHTGYRGINRFCRHHQELLKEYLSLRHRIPSHVTFRHVLMHIDQQAMIETFNQWACAQEALKSGVWLSGDGKTLCSTLKDACGSGQNFQAVVSLFAQQSGLVHLLGEYQNKTKEKGEQDVLRFLIEELQLKGIIIRTDALHTQKKNH